MNAAPNIDIQIATQTQPIPDTKDILHWASTVIDLFKPDACICIRIVDTAEITELNHRYRDKNMPTNVLAFPFEAPQTMNNNVLGDVIICAEIVNQEAKQQNKLPNAHWAHMVIHGILHLLGYDHIEDDDAIEMEAIERELLTKLGMIDI